MLRTYVNDPFDLKLTIRGLAHQIMWCYSDIYEYAYYFTFKKGMKAYEHEFDDAFELYVAETDYFKDGADPLVLNCHKAINRLTAVRDEIVLNWGLDEEKDLKSELVLWESSRYNPYKLNYKVGKTYRRLEHFYERTLAENITYFYLVACALTASKYRIPAVLKKQFEQPMPQSLRLLNHEDHNVSLLINLITGLQEDLDERRLAAKKLMLRRRSRYQVYLK